MENISGTTHALEVSYDGGNTFEAVLGTDNLGFDTTDDSLDRPFIDGTALNIQTAYAVSLTGRVTYMDGENQERLFGAYFYDANQALDSNPDIKVGSAGGMKLGLARKVQTSAIVRLRPLIAAQVDQTLNWVDANIKLGEPDFEDGLIATKFTISAKEVVKGDLEFNAGS